METRMEDMATVEAGAEPAMEAALPVSGLYRVIECMKEEFVLLWRPGASES